MVKSSSPAETGMIGKAIGEALRTGDVVLIKGELGAGKTQMVRGMANGLNTKSPARSPSYVIVNEYQGRIKLIHCDLYRISGELEADELALEEKLVNGALVVEWPDIAPKCLPPDALLVTISVGSSEKDRIITLTPLGDLSTKLVRRTAAVYECLSTLFQDSSKT